ncbi:MAG: hypothetical protein ABIQ31_13675 [Ferruginibacter sp.]
MKSLRFNFCHPIKGIASLTQLSLPTPMSQNIAFDSRETNVVEIPIGMCLTGKWQIVLNWERNEETFVLSKQFEIVNYPNAV